MDKTSGQSDNALVGIYRAKRDGKYLYVNTALARMTGYGSPQEFLQTVCSAAGLYADDERWSELLRLISLRGLIMNFESRAVRRDGKIIWISEHGREVRDPAGNLRYLEGYVNDITVYKANETRLREQDGLFRQVMDNIREVIIVQDLETGKIMYVSSCYEKLWGRPARELYSNPHSLIEAVHPEDRERLVRAMTLEGVLHQDLVDARFRIVHPGDRARRVSLRTFAVYDSKGSPCRLTHVFEEIGRADGREIFDRLGRCKTG